MTQRCRACGTTIAPAWKNRLELKAADLVTRSQAEEAADWFAKEYPDPWPIILARRDALKQEAATRRKGAA